MASEVVLYLVGVRLRVGLGIAPAWPAGVVLYMLSCASRAMISKILGREAYTSPATTASKLPSRWPHLGVAGRRLLIGMLGGRGTTCDLGRGPQRPQIPGRPERLGGGSQVCGEARDVASQCEERRRVSCDAASAAHRACSRTAPRGRRRRARP